MKVRHVLLGAIICLAFAPLAPGQSNANSSGSAYTPVEAYDPTRNADRDIQDAVAEARRTHKRVLVEVGGKWCSWCHTMDMFFQKNSELLALREGAFVMVKINFSKENENKQVLSRYPAIHGYPHLFVLDSDGKLLRSQNTSELEKGKSYNLGKFRSFLKKWAPSS